MPQSEQTSRHRPQIRTVLYGTYLVRKVIKWLLQSVQGAKIDCEIALPRHLVFSLLPFMSPPIAIFGFIKPLARSLLSAQPARGCAALQDRY